MHQIYCSNEEGVNYWLKDNVDKEIVDIKMTVNESGKQFIMVIYKIKRSGINEQ